MASVNPLLNLGSVRALVTGGGSGLGLATARSLVFKGAKVVIADLPSSKGAIHAEALGPGCVFQETDVTKESDVKAALDKLESRFKGRVNVVVNCAGIAVARRIFHPTFGPHPVPDFDRVMQVNTFGTFNVIRLASFRMSQNAPEGPDRSRGVIINTASTSAYDGQIGQTAYAASNGAIIGMTLPLARDLAPFGIRVVTIAGGLFDTPMLETLPAKVRRELGLQIPFPRRLAKPEEFAAYVESVIANPLLNGTTIRLDGGLRMLP